MCKSSPLKALKIRYFSNYQISVNPVKLLPQKQKNLEEPYFYSSPRLFLCLDTFTLIYVNLDFSLAETFALKLDKSLCPVINIMETSSSRALLTVRKLHSQMTFLLFWAMMLVAHGLPNMISGVNSIIFINMLAYPIPLPSILQQSEVLNLPELVTLPDRSKKEKALT